MENTQRTRSAIGSTRVVIDEGIELQVPPIYNNTNYLAGFQLLPHYALRTDLDRDFYKVMMHGDNKLRKELKRIVIKTFFLRSLLVIPILIGLVFAVYNYRESPYFFAYPAAIFIFVSLVSLTQIIHFVRYMRSVKDKETYLRLNSKLAAKLETSERTRYNQEVERVTYTLPPPTYHEANNLPPSYPA